MNAVVNVAFLAKAIDRAQHLPPEDPFCQALHEYIQLAGALRADEGRGLLWVEHPREGFQVAVWAVSVERARMAEWLRGMGGIHAMKNPDWLANDVERGEHWK